MKKIRDQITPGIVYLVIGTVQQIRFLFSDFPDTQLIYKHRPTTREMVRLIHEEDHDDETVIIINPKQSTYNHKSPGAGDELFGVPTRQLLPVVKKQIPPVLEPDPMAYYFICLDTPGVDRQDQIKFYRKLENPYQALDLTQFSYNLMESDAIEQAKQQQYHTGPKHISNTDVVAIVNKWRLYPYKAIQEIKDWPYSVTYGGDEWLSERFIQDLTPPPPSSPKPRQLSSLSKKEIASYCLNHLVYGFENKDGSITYGRMSPLLRALCAPMYNNRRGQQLVPYKKWVDHFGPGQELGLYLKPFLDLATTKYRSKPYVPINTFIRWVHAISRKRPAIYRRRYGKIEYTSIKVNSSAAKLYTTLLKTLL
jgi:hypothetical protein